MSTISAKGTNVSVLGGSSIIPWTPQTPSGLKAVMTSDTVMNLSVTNTSSGEDGLSWEYSTDDVTFTQKGTSVGSTYQATGLTPGTLYYWKVRQYKGASFGSYSNRDQEATLASVINSGDGKTWGHYDAKDLTTITMDGSSRMSAWNCKQGTGHNLLQAGADAIKPVHKYGHYVQSNGTNQFMKCAAATLNQPVTIYIVCRQKNWTSVGSWFDGNAANTGRIYQHDNSTAAGFHAYAGTDSTLVVGHYINNWGIIRVVFNGASSKVQLNTATAITGNFGAGNMGGFTLGCRGDNNYFAALEIKEIVIRNEADDTNYAAIYNYLYARHFNRSFEKGMCAFTFDNGNLSAYLRAYPLFANNGRKATFYFNSDLVGGVDPLGVDNMTWVQALEMYNAGMDCECHGQTHTGWLTLANAPPALHNELLAVSAAFVANGLPTPLHSAAPNGEELQSQVIIEVMGHRESMRDFISTTYTHKETNKYLIKEQHIDTSYMADLNTAYTKIDYCIANKCAIFFTAHDIRADDDNGGGIASIKIGRLTTIVNYAIASGIDIKTHKEIADLMDV